MLENTTSFRGAYTNIREAGLSGAREELVGLAGRATDVDNLLAGGGMSDGLRDWDLWGPLVFCLLLSLLLSFRALSGQKDLVFSGVFAMVWIGEAVVTMQIKLLGGNMYVSFSWPSPVLVVHDSGANTNIALSHNPSALSATRFSPSSSLHSSPPWVSRQSPEFLSTLSSLPGPWQQVSAS